MSVIALATVKEYLRVTHTSDDSLLQTLLDSAESEAMRFLNRSELPGSPYDLPEDSSSEPDITTETDVFPDVVVGVCLLVRVQYETAEPDDAAKWRRAAETLMGPYRTEMGV